MKFNISFITASIVLLISIIFSISIFPYHLNHGKNPEGTEVIPLPGGAVGPESFAFDPSGDGPYTGVSDGRIIKWQQNESRWIDFALTNPNKPGCEQTLDYNNTGPKCGRPLGLQFNHITGDLYIADAYLGLLVVGPTGGVATVVATQAEGVPFRFTNDVDIDQSTGVVYFSDSSSRYYRRDFLSVIVSGDKTGRLMKYDPDTKEIKVLLNNLSFPNSISLGRDGEFLLIAETTKCMISKFWLRTSKAGTLEVFAKLPGFVDNISRNEEGEYWVGIYMRRTKLLKWALSYPWVGNVVTNLPFDITKMFSVVSKFRGHGLALKLRDDGEILDMLEDRSGNIFKCVSEVNEKNGSLWIGSVIMPYAARQEISKGSNKI